MNLSRRDFLKLAGAGALGIFLNELHFERVFAAPPPTQGRMTLSGINQYDAPSFKAKSIHVFGKDEVVNGLRQRFTLKGLLAHHASVNEVLDSADRFWRHCKTPNC